MPWELHVATNVSISSANHLKVRFIQQSHSQFDDDNYDTYVLNKDETIIYHHDKSRIGQKIDDNSLKQMALLGNKGNFRLTDSQGAALLNKHILCCTPVIRQILATQNHTVRPHEKAVHLRL